MLVSVTLSGTLAMHLFVPALPAASQALGASASVISLAITFYVGGLGLGQLVYGPVSDAFGRRAPLLLGLALYTVAGAVAAASTRADVLIVARLLQACGGCAGMLLCRAMIRDTCDTPEAITRLAIVSAMVILGPAVAPLLGGLMAAHWGWRSVLMLPVALGLLNLALAWQLLPETGAPHGRLNARLVLEQYRDIASLPVFRSYALAGSLSSTSLYALIASAPFIFSRELDLPIEQGGTCLSIAVIGIVAGNVAAASLMRRARVETVLLAANAWCALSALLLVIAALVHAQSAALVVGLMTLFCTGVGLCTPASTIKAMSVKEGAVGSASGLFGASQMLFGVISTTLSAAGDGRLIVVATILLGGALLAQLFFQRAMRAEERLAATP